MKLGSSRFCGLPSSAAKAILGLLAAVMLLSLWPAVQEASSGQAARAAAAAESPAKGDEDLALYAAIISRVAAGENYHAVAADEQRNRGFPLRPFVTMRLPTLALVIAALGIGWAHALQMGIAMAAVLAWNKKLARETVDGWQRLALLGLLSVGLLPVLFPYYITLHDIWAGALVALSLGLYRPDRWLPSLIVAGCALALREQVLPFVLLMAAFALWHGRWRELMGWAVLTAAFAGLLVWHMQAVAAVILPADHNSPPWTVMGGPSAALNFLWQTSPLLDVPALLSYPLIVLSVFGWFSWRSEAGLFGGLLLCGYMLAFMITGRPNVFYWGFTVAPLLLAGLVFARTGIQDLLGSGLRPVASAGGHIRSA